jgi:hypothetical protein
VIDSDLPAALLMRLIDRLGQVAAATIAESRRPPTLLRGSLGCDAGAVGAASLPLHMTYNPLPAVLTSKTSERA